METTAITAVHATIVFVKNVPPAAEAVMKPFALAALKDVKSVKTQCVRTAFAGVPNVATIAAHTVLKMVYV